MKFRNVSALRIWSKELIQLNIETTAKESFPQLSFFIASFS